MPQRSKLQGCITAIVTPFKESGAVDFDALESLVEEQIAAGVQGLVPCGTTGESPTLSHEEHREVVRRVVERARQRVAVVAGCGSNSTEEALSLTRFAAEVGADASLQVVPYYNKPTPEGLFRHFEAIARATPLPLVLYNIPGRTGVNMTPQTIARLAKIETVVAVKEAAGSLDQVSEILDLCEIDVFSGDDSLTLPMLAVGAVGVISVASNVAPREVAALCDHFRAGRWAEALALHRRLFPLVKALFCETSPGPVKAALALMGRGNGLLRLPLVPPAEASIERVRQELARFGLVR
jgi:4-hydroxy-tetrahydrodipicolinate synthase